MTKAIATIVCDEGKYGLLVDRDYNVICCEKLGEWFKQFTVRPEYGSIFQNAHFKPRALEIEIETFNDLLEQPLRISQNHRFWGVTRYVYLRPEVAEGLYAGAHEPA